jgi:hypothetical protein
MITGLSRGGADALGGLALCKQRKIGALKQFGTGRRSTSVWWEGRETEAPFAIATLRLTEGTVPLKALDWFVEETI